MKENASRVEVPIAVASSTVNRIQRNELGERFFLAYVTCYLFFL